LCSSAESHLDTSVQIGKALATLTTLEQLEMPQNGIGAAGIASLAEAIRVNTNLSVLNLNDNIMTAKGGLAVAEALIHNKSIRVINFGDCLLRAKGGVHIIQALLDRESGLGQLRDINLSGNELGGEECVEKLLEFSRREDKSPMMKLDISCNAFGEETVDLLKSNIGKESVDLILTDDEGTADEEEEEEEDVEDEEEEHDSGHDDSLPVESPVKADPVDKELDALTEVLQNEDTNVEQLCELFVNISIESFDQANGSLDEKALKKTESILDSAKKRSSGPFETTNALLAQMGLIKTEDQVKSSKEVKDLRGPFLALSNSASKLDKTEKDVLQLFLGNRQNKAADAAGTYKHKLMQSLF
jgi:Ran GTPase-activating protein 1